MKTMTQSLPLIAPPTGIQLLLQGEGLPARFLGCRGHGGEHHQMVEGRLRGRLRRPSAVSSQGLSAGSSVPARAHHAPPAAEGGCPSTRSHLAPTTPYPRLFSTERRIDSASKWLPSSTRRGAPAFRRRGRMAGPRRGAPSPGGEHGTLGPADNPWELTVEGRRRRRRRRPSPSRRNDVSTAHQSGCRRGGAGPRRRACTWRRPWNAPALRITPGISQRKGRRCLDGNERGPAADDGIDCNDAVRQRSMSNANTPCPQRHLTPELMQLLENFF